MQKLKKYLREIMIGGIYLIFPLTLLIYVIRMAHDFIAIMIRPISDALPGIIPGYDGSVLLAAVVLINLCFLGGIFLLNKNNRSRFDSLERNFLMVIPGYNKLKLTASLLVSEPQLNIQVVAIHVNDAITLGLLMETDGDWCNIYTPGSPDVSTGSIKFHRCSAVIKTDISAKELIMAMKARGVGSSDLISKITNDIRPAQTPSAPQQSPSA